MTSKVKWTAVVITCPRKEWSLILQRELEFRQTKGYIDKDVFLLAVEDPKQDVGSGGATINALLTVAEYISAQRGFTVLTTDILKDACILILHNGRGYAYDSCGRPFTSLPVKMCGLDHEGIVSMVDLTVKLITETIGVHSGAGVWVSSLDMILSLPYNEAVPWEKCDVCAITVPSSPTYCRQHGVYKLDSQGFVEDILFQETLENMEKCERKDGTVAMVCGMVYFSPQVSETLLSFFTKPPLDACTYFGLDSGEPTIKLSLFFDVMLPMCSGVNAREFRSGARSGSYGKDVAVSDIKTMRAARTILWEDLHKFKIKACMLEEGTCVFPRTIQEHKRNILERSMETCFPEGQLIWNNITHSHIKNQANVDPSSVIINSLLHENVSVGTKCVISHSHIQGDVIVAKDSVITGLVTGPEFSSRVEFGEAMIIQCFNIYLPFLGRSMYVMTTHGRFDNIQSPMWKSTSSFCNDPWMFMMNRTGIIKEDLWGQDCETDDQTIETALLFPVFHAIERVGLTEILWLQGVIQDSDDKHILRRWKSSWRLSLRDIQKLIDFEKEFNARRELFYTVGEFDLKRALLNQENKGFRAFYNSAVVEGYTQHVLGVLDEVCEMSLDELQAGTAARTLANIADVLGCMAGPKGGLRSGPAANKDWAVAFDLLEKHNIHHGIDQLKHERGQWLDRPDKLIRAARHYEGAAQILIRHAVMTAKQHVTLTDAQPTGLGHWVLAECPARIDISGGWSDTPPITYEHGGAVTMAALLVNGKRPIGAKSRRIKEPKLVLVLHGSTEAKEVVCTELSDLSDYYQPHSPGALLKAAFVCAELVDLTSDKSLTDQLTARYGGGFELHSWTNLPQGSGLGTSSILAGAVMASLLKTAGKSCDLHSLVHMVLYLEQLLTTGGGWQDQVGGLMGGVRLGVSEAGLPLKVDAHDLDLGPEVVQAFNDRLVLIYTGKTRLARNLLQDVVRNWYARNPQIVETEDRLVSQAHDCAKFFQQGDLEKVGQCMDQYWTLKKRMAPGCEPEFVSRLMSAVRSNALGMSMAGAGGGGFMYVLARDQEARTNIKNIIDSMESMDGVCVYEACLDTEGMVVTVIEEDGPSEPISEGDEDMSTYYNQPETLLDDDHAPSLPGDVDMVSLVANLSAGLAQGMGTEEGGTQKSGTDGEELKGEGSKDAEIKGEGVEKKGEDVGTEDVVGGPSTAGCGDMGSVNISNKTSIGSGDNNDASQTVAPTGSGESEKVPTCQTSSAEESAT
ncbi:L-fucose kinase-like [Mya arenaria]|uniref:L-fucose kinase-like n=1 Tax=Mya arenaria TaxID=6604 RepID=UPI0022E7F89D|nr:L-fucose kinase-like [Mya arenaria]